MCLDCSISLIPEVVATRADVSCQILESCDNIIDGFGGMLVMVRLRVDNAAEMHLTRRRSQIRWFAAIQQNVSRSLRKKWNAVDQFMAATLQAFLSDTDYELPQNLEDPVLESRDSDSDVYDELGETDSFVSDSSVVIDPESDMSVEEEPPVPLPMWLPSPQTASLKSATFTPIIARSPPRGILKPVSAARQLIDVESSSSTPVRNRRGRASSPPRRFNLRRFGVSQAVNESGSGGSGSSDSYSNEEGEMDTSDNNFIASSGSSNPSDITQYRLADLSQERRQRWGRPALFGPRPMGRKGSQSE
jgi:hypothetical protein